MASILLFFIGIIIVIIALAIFAKQLFQAIVELLALIVNAVYDFFVVIPRHKKSKYYQEKVKKKVQEQYNREEKEESMRRAYVLGAMNYVTKWRVFYPMADEALFKRAESELPNPNCLKQPADFEKEIKESHLKNLQKQKEKIDIENKVYTLADLDNLTPIEVRKENPITMKLYKIDDNYLLWIGNSLTTENSLFQSKDYGLMASYMISVVETQQKLKQMKLNVSASQLEDIFNDKTQKFGDDFNRRQNLFG